MAGYRLTALRINAHSGFHTTDKLGKTCRQSAGLLIVASHVCEKFLSRHISVIKNHRYLKSSRLSHISPYFRRIQAQSHDPVQLPQHMPVCRSPGKRKFPAFSHRIEIHLHTVLRQLLRLLLCRPGHMLEIGMVFRTRNKKTDLQFLLHHRQSLRYLIGPVVQFLHNGLYTLFRLCIHHTPVVQNAVNRPDRYPRLFGNLFNRRHAVISPCFLPLYRCFCL